MSIFWDDDFEGVQIHPDWTDYGLGYLNTSDIHVSNEQAYIGSQSLRCNYPQLGRDGGPFIDRFIPGPSPTGETDLWVRAMIRLSAGFTVDSITTKLIYLRNETGTGFPSAAFDLLFGSKDLVFVVQNATDQADTTNYSFGVTLGNYWTEAMCHWRMNTVGQSNGLLRLYVNGQLTLESLNRMWRDSTSSRIDTIRLFVQAGLGQVYYDRMTVGNTQISSLVGGPDTTPPSPPQGITVQ